MTFQTWLMFCITETVLSFTPGPAVLFVISTSLARGARAGLAASLGILSINVFYFALSATSLGAILAASWQLFEVIKWLGAAYLVWLGLQMVFTSGGGSKPAGELPQPTPRSARRAYRLGVLTQGANPKAIAFFTAILPQFIDTEANVGWQVLILGVSSVLLEFAILSVYVVTCHTARRWARNPRLATPLKRVGGVLLIAAGARLAATRRV
jgi:threonine/homoserine/homoserine lactone efflux protein